MKKKVIASLAISCVVSAVTTLVLLTVPAVSTSSSISVLQKAALSGMYDCYHSGAYKTVMSFSDYSGPSSIIDNADASRIYLPNGATTLEDNIVNCSEVLSGASKKHIFSSDEGFSGLYALAGKIAPSIDSSPEEKTTFLTNMGYDKSEESNGECTEITYTRGQEKQIIRICATDLIGSDEIINVDEMTISYSGGKSVLQVTPSSGKIVCTKASVSWWTIKFLDKNNTATINFEKGKTKWEDFAIAIREQHCAPDTVSYLYADENYTYTRESVTDTKSNEVATQFSLPIRDIDNAANKAIFYLSNRTATTRDDLKLTASEKANLLQYYLDNYYKIEKRCNLSAVDAAQARSEGYEAATIIDNNHASSCYIKPMEHKNDSVYIWNSSSYLGQKNTAKYSEVLSLLSSLLGEDVKERCNTQLAAAASEEWNKAFKRANNPTATEAERQRAEDYMAKVDALRESGQYWEENNGVISCVTLETFEEGDQIIVDDGYEGTIDGDDYNGTGTTDGCSLNAGALGWIICPVIKALGEATGAMFDAIGDQYLSIDSAIINDSGMSQAWSFFQTFANTIFVIFLIIVILSQVTGVGISNYGVKKALPRLIIAAILVNLSFFICALAADLSNVTGSGLKDLFTDIKLSSSVDDVNFGTFITNTIASIGSTAVPLGVAGVALSIAIADGGWEVLIMPLLLGIIVAFFAILFFFVLLAVRKAAVFILIAISPIAVVCYVLPNTQKLFSRWLKMFSSLLLVYPICGLVMGGGSFASHLLLLTAGQSGFVYYLVCMLISVVPFFFIPTLLKNSMSALGSIGSKIAGLQSKWTNKATGAVRGSRWAQDHQQELARKIDINRSNRLKARSQKVIDKLNGKRTNPNERGDLSGLSAKEREKYLRAQRRGARATLTLSRRRNEDVEAGNIAEYYNEEMLQNQEATARRKYREGVVNNIADGIISSGRYNRSDNRSDEVDFNDPRDIERALINLLQDVQDNPNDDMAMARLEGMMELAKRKGSKGRRAIINALYDREATPEGLEAARSVAKRLALDDKFMGSLHSYDAGSEEHIQNLAAAEPVKRRSDYAQTTIESMKLETVGDLDDSFQDNLKEMHKEIVGLRENGSDPTRLGKLAASYKKAVSIMQQAASDPRYAGKIKSKDGAGFINEHVKNMYDIERNDWLSGTDANGVSNLQQLQVTGANGIVSNASGMDDANGYLTDSMNNILRDANGNAVKATDAYAQQIKAFDPVVLGKEAQKEIKIPRKKALPDGWKWESKQGWYREEDVTLPNGMPVKRIVKLNPEEVKRAELISEHNAKVDLMTEEINETNNANNANSNP